MNQPQRKPIIVLAPPPGTPPPLQVLKRVYAEPGEFPVIIPELLIESKNDEVDESFSEIDYETSLLSQQHIEVLEAMEALEEPQSDLPLLTPSWPFINLDLDVAVPQIPSKEISQAQPETVFTIIPTLVKVEKSKVAPITAEIPQLVFPLKKRSDPVWGLFYRNEYGVISLKKIIHDHILQEIDKPTLITKIQEYLHLQFVSHCLSNRNVTGIYVGNSHYNFPNSGNPNSGNPNRMIVSKTLHSGGIATSTYLMWKLSTENEVELDLVLDSLPF